jgi:predicted metalloprotease with PDZ domain
MKRFANVLAVVMIVGMAMTVVAGEGGKCTASTQDCLDYMASNMKERGWVGLELEDKGDDGRMIVAKVVANSPASSAGFEVGDALVAVNGVAFSDANEKKLKEIKYSMKPGAEFTYTVARRGSRIDLAVELAQIPQDVMAQWVGNHMLDHAETQMASAE